MINSFTLKRMLFTLTAFFVTVLILNVILVPNAEADYRLSDVSSPNEPIVPDESSSPYITWSQPPMEIIPNTKTEPLLCGWSEPARSTQRTDQKRQWRMDADDFRVTGTAPVTRLRWWGGYKAWGHPEAPEPKPQIWHG